MTLDYGLVGLPFSRDWVWLLGKLARSKAKRRAFQMWVRGWRFLGVGRRIGVTWEA